MKSSMYIIISQSRTLLLISLAASGPRILLSQETEEDSDLASRGPYEFQFRVDDPETYNKYEVDEGWGCTFTK